MGQRTKIVSAVVATACVALGASAYADALPGGAQRVAHDVIGAPAAPAASPTHSPGPPGGTGHGRTAHPAHPAHPARSAQPARSGNTPVGPDATGPAAHGLCTAYLHAHSHGRALGRSVAMRNLARAAGGRAKIVAYCATIPRPRPEPSESD